MRASGAGNCGWSVESEDWLYDLAHNAVQAALLKI
jgi:hypothetical protein